MERTTLTIGNTDFPVHSYLGKHTLEGASCMTARTNHTNELGGRGVHVHKEKMKLTIKKLPHD